MALYPGMKPMLEFTKVPERIEGKPRRRRCAVKTPKNPRVKSVPVGHDDNKPDIRWVSPQFSVDNSSDVPLKTRRKRRQPLEMKTVQPVGLTFNEDSPHISLYPSMAPHMIRTHQQMTYNSDCYSEDNSGDHSADQTVPDMATSLPCSPSVSPSQTNDSQSSAMTENQVNTKLNSHFHDVSTHADTHMDNTAHMDLSSTQATLMDVTNTQHVPTSSVRELSDLVANMSIEEEAQSLKDTLHHSVLDKNNTSFKPPTTSTPYRNHLSHCSPTDTNTTEQSQRSAAVSSNFVLQVTESQSENSDVTESYHGDSDITTSYHGDSDITESYHGDSALSLEDSDLAEGNNKLTECKETRTCKANLSTCNDSSSDFVFAPETPQHLWLSPVIRVIENSFS